MRQIKAAVIGTGFIGTVHAEAIGRAGGQVIGVLGSSPHRAAALASRCGVPAFESLDALLDSPVEVVHVASPNALHAEHAEAVLRAGKHLICEKPLTTDSAAARRLVALAEAQRLVGATCFNLRFYPLVHQARELLCGGSAGSPRLVTGSYRQDWLLHSTDWNWRVDAAVGGPTRAVADIGSHLLDSLGFVLAAPVESLYARLHTTVETRQSPTGSVRVSTDDAAHLLVQWGNGTHGSLVVSQVSPGRKNELAWSIDGSRGALDWSSERPDELRLGWRDAPNQVLLRDPASLSPAAAAVSFYPAGHVEGFAETFRGLFERVYAHIRGETAGGDYPTLQDGLTAVLIDEAIRASAATDSWQAIER